MEDLGVLQATSYAIWLIGPPMAGKTLIFRRLTDSFTPPPHAYDATGYIQMTPKMFSRPHKDSVHVNIWDTSGANSFMPVLWSAMRNSSSVKGAVLVFSLQSMESFIDVKNVRYEKVRECIGDDAPIVMIGIKYGSSTEIKNLSQNEDAHTFANSDGITEQSVKQSAVENFQKECGVKYFELNGDSEEGLNQPFLYLLQSNNNTVTITSECLCYIALMKLNGEGGGAQEDIQIIKNKCQCSLM